MARRARPPGRRYPQLLLALPLLPCTHRHELILRQNKELQKWFGHLLPPNGFANWLPCHPRCNQRKGARIFRLVPENSFILERLMRVAPAVERTAMNVGTDAEKDKLIGSLSA